MIGQRDMALLLHAAQSAAESLQDRAESAGVTMTLATDEVAEIAEQFARCVAILKAAHLAAADPPKSGRRPRVA